MDPAAGPIGRYFDGEATSEVGLKSSGGEDFWTAFQPDLTSLGPDIERGNRQLADAGPQAQGIAIIALAQSYATDPPPANFRVIVNPLVVWVWVGGLLALGGVLFAVWPTAESRRRAEAAYAARLGRELSRG
jgi:cytochrome c-type biogenesis protein CcmF